MNLRYQILDRLYQGKGCEVFLVRDIVNKQLYALKRINKHQANYSDAYLRAIYQREAGILGWLKHARIPRLITAFEEEHMRFILMEYIPGISLMRMRNAASEVQRYRWYFQLANVLYELHMQEVLHLDIKPQNMLLWKEQLFLLDFATSCFRWEHYGVCARSPGYSPREIGTPQCDERSDIYSYGRCCYVLRHGCFPHTHAQTDALDSVFLTCCAERKEDRYASMQEVMKELERVCIQ